VDGDEAWVAFADRVLRIDLSWARGPRVFATAPESAAKVKWVATCTGCTGVVFIVDFDRGTAIRWAARDGSSPPVELVAPDPAAHWKSVALGEGGPRVWAADVRGDQIRELRIDPATGARLGDRKLAEVEAPYAVTALGEAGLLVTTHDDRIRWLDLEGGTRADWDVAGACPYESENRGPLRRALRDPASGDLSRSTTARCCVSRSMERASGSPAARSSPATRASLASWTRAARRLASAIPTTSRSWRTARP